MKFPYIPISFIVSDIKAELKQMDQAGEINDEDCLNWAIECLREIGGENYETKPAILTVKDHVATLPTGFYLVDHIFLAETNGSTPGANWGKLIWFSYESRDYCKGKMLYPGDSMTGLKMARQHGFNTRNLNEDTYVIKGQQLRCSIRNCTIGMEYLSLAYSEEQGGYLMQDEIYTSKAVKAFIKLKLFEEKFYMNQIPQYIYQKIEQEYESNTDQAQAVFKFPDPTDQRAMGKRQNHRYDAFKLR